MSNMNSNFFLSSNFLLVGGRCIWSVVGWLVISGRWSVGRCLVVGAWLVGGLKETRCVFAYFCGGHKNNFLLWFRSSFKVKHKLYPKITSYIFMEMTNNQYNLQNCTDFTTPQVKGVYHGTESITCLRPKTWDIFPEEIKLKKSRSSFKNSVEMSVPITCFCRLYKFYLDEVGF